MVILKRVLVALVVVVIGVWAFNSPLMRSSFPETAKQLVAHRGVHQTFPAKGITNDTCTARLIDQPSHELIENTLPSMKAAFEAGADIVELDIHLTIDDKWAVYHDWTLDCRSDGQGPVRDATMKFLKTLDIGYGYSADDGKTFPLRGKYVGAMPELEEVFAAFPGNKFLINFKSNDADEGKAFAQFLTSNPNYKKQIWAVYGGAKPTAAVLEAHSDMKGYTKQSVKACLKSYVALGWSGHVPQECHNQILAVPSNYARWMWGWPGLFHQRVKEAGSELILLGDYSSSNTGSRGLDERAVIDAVPAQFGGYLWTNKIEVVGPDFKK
jgi:glycerophosphoryl diester phosphodiesterase